MYKKAISIFGALLISISIAGITGIPQVRAQEEVAPKEQTMVWGANKQGPLPTVNPLDSRIIAINYVYPNVYEPLCFVDPIRGKFIPVIAKEWKWVNGHTFQVALNPHAHFRDGSSVTAEDVVFSYETMGNPDYGGRLKPALEIVESFEVVDDQTFRIHVKADLPERYGKVMTLLLPPSMGPLIFQKERWSKLIDEYGKEILTFTNMDISKINGTGPYTLLKSTGEVGTWRRVDDYWGNEIGRFFVPKYYKTPWVASGEIILRGLEDGSFDIGQITGVDQEYLEKHKIPGGLLWSWNPEGPPTEWKDYEPSDFYCILNLEKKIFRQSWFRHAAAYAMDYDKLVEVGGTAEIGYPSPPYYLSTKLPWEEYYNSDIVKKHYETEDTGGFTHIKHDPEKAIEILKEHCEGSVEEGWTWNGEKVGPFDVLGWKGPSDVMACVRVIATSLQDIGIDARPDLPVYSVWDEKCMNWTFDIRWGLTGCSIFPKPIAQTYNQVFLMPGTTWTGSKCNYFKYWTENYPSTEDTADEIRSLVNELWVTPPGTERSFELAKEIQKIVIPQLPIIPTYQKASPLEFTVADFVNYPYKDDPLDWITKIGGSSWASMLHVYPRRVITTGFSLSKREVSAGETVTAEVTLKNEGKEKQMYPVYLHKGPADSGLSVGNRIAWKAPTVSPGETKTVKLGFTIEEPGDYTITVDDWRYSKWDPGDPKERTLTVTPEVRPISEVVKDLRSDVNSLKDSLKDSLSEVNERLSEIQKAKRAPSTTMVITIMIVTIVVALAGAYVIASRRTAK